MVLLFLIVWMRLKDRLFRSRRYVLAQRNSSTSWKTNFHFPLFHAQCLLSALTPGSFSNDVLSLTLSSNSSQATINSFTYDVVGINLHPSTGCPTLPIPKKGGGAAKKEVVTKVHTDVPIAVNQWVSLARSSLRGHLTDRRIGDAGQSYEFHHHQKQMVRLVQKYHHLKRDSCRNIGTVSYT